MEQKTITVTLNKAIEWYNSGNEVLVELALQAFDEEDLTPIDFTKIKTFEDACNTLGYDTGLRKVINELASYSKASAAMFKLNIVRKALNKGYNMHLARQTDNQTNVYFPNVGFFVQLFYNESKQDDYEMIGEFMSEGVVFKVVNKHTDCGSFKGLGNFNSDINMNVRNTSVGFLGCATEKIAEHFGKYFGMLIVEAMYGDMVDFNITKCEKIKD